jgi:hypothetical protein
VSTHVLKVQAPYFEALLSGEKTFEVRKNDRGFQRGDMLHLREWDGSKCNRNGGPHQDSDCPGWGATLSRRVSYVYSGDPRFGGIESGYVVLGLDRGSDV